MIYVIEYFYTIGSGTPVSQIIHPIINASSTTNYCVILTPDIKNDLNNTVHTLFPLQTIFTMLFNQEVTCITSLPIFFYSYISLLTVFLIISYNKVK